MQIKYNTTQRYPQYGYPDSYRGEHTVVHVTFACGRTYCGSAYCEIDVAQANPKYTKIQAVKAAILRARQERTRLKTKAYAPRFGRPTREQVARAYGAAYAE